MREHVHTIFGLNGGKAGGRVVLGWASGGHVGLARLVEGDAGMMVYGQWSGCG